MANYCVYGYLESHRKRVTWALMRSLSERFQLPWLCMSDFNNFLSVQDKWGGVSYLDNICRRFQDCIADCGLIEVSLLGPFTWERGSGTAHFVMERLDMAFANARWMQMFPYFKLFNLVSATSDHNPSKLVACLIHPE